MTVKLQTIKDIRNYLSLELSHLYSDAELMSISNTVISKISGISKSSFLSKGNELKIERKDAEIVVKYCNRLKTGKPLQYVTGEAFFYGLVLKVKPGVLIPRPETEELVDLVVKENKGFSGRILDIGTGSGAIAIALSLSFPSAYVLGIDISSVALKIARNNVLSSNANVDLRKADIFKIEPSETPDMNLIISNPPYVRQSEKHLMKHNVLDFEPHKALFVPDRDPLKYYRAILKLAKHSLKNGGLVYFEINEAMGEQVSDLLRSHTFRLITTVKDINGKDRIVKALKDD